MGEERIPYPLSGMERFGEPACGARTLLLAVIYWAKMEALGTRVGGYRTTDAEWAAIQLDAIEFFLDWRYPAYCQALGLRTVLPEELAGVVRQYRDGSLQIAGAYQYDDLGYRSWREWWAEHREQWQAAWQSEDAGAGQPGGRNGRAGLH